MGKPAQAFIDIQAKFPQARVHLLAMSQLLACWKEFNQVAATHLATTAKLEAEEEDMSRQSPSKKGGGKACV